MTPQIITNTNDYLVLNKPTGWSVEASPPTPSIYDWLKGHDDFKAVVPGQMERGGVVHRLDVDTSGVLIWAKNADSQARLKLLWQGRQVEKTYLALVAGETPSEGTIELSIERDNKQNRQKVALLPGPKSRSAITSYTRLAVGEWEGEKLSLMEAHPITGRTHQLRVHFKAIGHPIIGDKLYGEKATNELAKELGVTRQFLHAWKISVDGKDYVAPLSEDLEGVLNRLSITI